jgi:glutathione S-transferase
MTDYKLTYFDMDGGRAEPVRIAFHAAGVDFEDVRISFAEFAEMRDGFRFRCAPVLEIDGLPVTQSNAMARYVGKKAGLYPDDDLQALYCDEAMGAIEDLLHAIVHTFGLEGDELKVAREELVDGWITTFLKGLDEMLERGGDYFADNRLTVADLKVAGITAWFESGGLDHVPTDLVKRVAPRLSAHKDRVFGEPVVSAYYASRAAA